MRAKPRVKKCADGWMVDRPRYGFGHPTTDGPYPTHAVAIASLAVSTGAAAAVIERTTTPEGPAGTWQGMKPMWPMEIR